MFRKLLYFILIILPTISSYAQKDYPDATCFDVKITRQNMADYHSEAPDSYVVCKDEKVTISPTLTVPYIRKTNEYTVEAVPFNAYPFTGTDITNTRYDNFSEDILKLPFEFCFFDKTYTGIAVHTNNLMRLTNAATPGAAGAHPGSQEPAVPLASLGPEFNFALMLYKHTHWGHDIGSNATNGSVNYAVYGEAPCRAFVINLFELNAYGLQPQYCSMVPYQTTQYVMYETTNVLEVNVFQHNGCPFDSKGMAVLGIRGANGAESYSPPGRDTGLFDINKAQPESWRFGPAGDRSVYQVNWYVDGVLVDTGEKPITVTVDKAKQVRVELITETCNESYRDWYDIKLRPAIELDDLELEEQIVCDKDQNTFDLNTMSDMVKENQSGTNPGKLTFLFYQTEEDALNKTNRITNPAQFPIKVGETKVYMRIESELEKCFEIIPVTIIKAPVEVKVPKNVNLCTEYTLPPLTDDEFYYKLERLDEDASFVVQTLPQPSVGQVINTIGYYRVTIKKTNQYGCEDMKSFILFVENCSYPKGISPNGDGNNDNLDLTYNNVVELKIYNRYGKLVFVHDKGRYKRQWAGQDTAGKPLPSGTYFMYVRTKNNEYQDWIQLMQEVK